MSACDVGSERSIRDRRPHCTAVTISESVGVRKPRPEIFRHALEALGVEPEETVHVGDNLDADIRGASLLGMRPIWDLSPLHS